MDWNGFISALLGAIVGGVFTIWGAHVGAKRSHHDQLKRDAEAEHERIRNVLRAILAEMEALMGIYMSGTGALLDATTSLHDSYFIMSSRYFQVYEGNCGNLGSLPPELSRRIIEAYNIANLLIENLRINNHLLDARGKAGPMIDSVSAEQRLIEHFQKLKSVHERFKESCLRSQDGIRVYLKMDPLVTSV